MAFRPSRLASAAAMAAALSLTATPVAAAELPAIAVGDAQVQTGDAGELNQYRHRRHRHRDRGVDAGDVIAGVVVLGALAAIIGSSRDNDRDRYEPRREDVRYDPRQRERGYDSRGIENAVDMCIDEVEYRDNRVDSVDQASRSASGWYVSGALDNGERWSCWIDNRGQISGIDYGEVAYSQTPGAVSGGQLSDAAYARARASTRTAADEAYSYRDEPVDYASDGPAPAYPGGPLPGEDGYDADWQVDGDLDDGEWEGDGRYSTAQAPDFEQQAR